MATLNKIELREADLAEVAAGGMTAEEAISISMELSTRWEELCVNGETLCYWGYRHDTAVSAHAYMWLLSCPPIEKYKTFFLRYSIARVEELFETHYKLSVAVHQEYEKAIRWLRWLGFREVQVVGEFIEMQATRGGAA